MSKIQPHKMPAAAAENRLTPDERRAAFSLSAIFAFRMIGLFMLLPVLAIYGQNLGGYSPQTVGLAIGIYGLVQAVVTIPLGRWSDTWGRKKVITLGLCLFALGAIMAALSTHIYGVIAGRALQGAGAIAGVVLALAADLTVERRRSKVMAVIGMSIGASFLLAFGLGPVIAAHFGLAAVFWTTAGLAGIGLLLTHTVVPAEPAPVAKAGNQHWRVLFALLKQGQLGRLSFGIFVLHVVMTACFVVMPLELVRLGLPAAQHGSIYLPVMLLGAVVMMPFLRMAEHKGWHRPLLLGAVLLLALALLGLALAPALTPLIVALGVFFTAFNWLEASLPSWVSRVVPAEVKGTAMGFYTSAQFFGAFVGGAGAGFLFTHWGASAVLYVSVGACLLWALLAFGLKPLPQWADLSLSADDPETLAQWMRHLQALDGVSDIALRADESRVQLRYDQRVWREDELNERVQDQGGTRELY